MINTDYVKKEKPINVILDMDGVIIDTHKLHEEAWFLISEYYNFQWPEHINFKRDVFGTSSVDSFKLLFSGKIETVNFDIIHNKKNQFYKHLLEKEIHNIIVPGFVDFFNELMENDIEVVVANSSIISEADFVLSSINIKDKIKKIITISVVNKPKPHPEIFLKAKEAFKTFSGAYIGFEDSLFGIQALISAGVNIIVVGTTLTKSDFNKINYKNKKYINSFKEITYTDLKKIN